MREGNSASLTEGKDGRSEKEWQGRRREDDEVEDGRGRERVDIIYIIPGIKLSNTRN